jgi:ribosomal protein L3 glutamine methyltransferase
MFRCSGLCFDNGMQNPFHEAEYLVCHTLSLPLDDTRHRRFPVPPAARATLLSLFEQRCRRRIPVAYLTGEAFFAGERFHVDARVLIPRSRLENLLDDEEGLAPWIPDAAVHTILDVGTGSGCLAILLALRYPEAHVDGVDLSAPALRVAIRNRDDPARRHWRLRERVRFLHSDLFRNLGENIYDLIVSNPPYVPESSHAHLPAEYHREPALALRGGVDGLDVVERLLLTAADHLTPHGILICEVGDEVEPVMTARWPDLLVDWIFFDFDGVTVSGVFLARAAWLKEWQSRCR